MAKLHLNKDGINTVLYLLAMAQDKNGELSKAQKQLKKACDRALTPIAVSSGKAKGRNLQQFVCTEIAELLGLEYKQVDDNCLIHSREMGQAGTDIALRGEAQKRFPFAVECKAVESFSMYSAIEQAQANTKEGLDWLLVHKKKNNKPVAVLDWQAFKRIMKANN
jgi:hypothetical protein